MSVHQLPSEKAMPVFILPSLKHGVGLDGFYGTGCVIDGDSDDDHDVCDDHSTLSTRTSRAVMTVRMRSISDDRSLRMRSASAALISCVSRRCVSIVSCSRAAATALSVNQQP